MWLLATALFRLYVANVGGYDSYGVVDAVLVLLLWLYLTALAILFGGEVVVSLEQGVHRSDTGFTRHRQAQQMSQGSKTLATDGEPSIGDGAPLPSLSIWILQ